MHSAILVLSLTAMQLAFVGISLYLSLFLSYEIICSNSVLGLKDFEEKNISSCGIFKSNTDHGGPLVG